MIIVFDLDDTLYDEITYVRSSLFEVSLYLSEKLHISNGKYQSLLDVESMIQQFRFWKWKARSKV